MRRVLEWGAASVASVADETGDVRVFEIVPERFVAAGPGSHIGVAVQVGGRAETRSYSLLACAAGRYRIAVKRLADSRGGSAYMHSLAAGALLSVSAPGNHFELAPERPFYLLVAGGIGITPIYAMATALAARGAAFRLVYAARRRADLAFMAGLRALVGERLAVFVDEEGARVDLAGEIAAMPAGGEMYVCGPIGMLEAAKLAWAASGRPVDGLRFETFGNSGRFATEAFSVRIPGLGREIVVGREQTMLDALEAAGVGMIYDCRRGECGLCAVRIVSAEGAVDHRDVFFSEAQKAANTHLCTCVSRVAGGALVIETADR